MPISLSREKPDALSLPLFSELSENERSPRTSTSAVPSPQESPSSSRTSVSALDSRSSSCDWIRFAAANVLIKSSQLCAGQSFAALNFLWALCSAFCWVFHNKLCNFFFRCGCTWNWAGSWDRCNVHNARGPRCPWCAAPSDYPNFLWAADGKLFTLAMVGAALFSMRCVPVKSFLLRCLCAASCGVCTWVLLCMLSALTFWKLTDYPYFMWYSKPPYPNQTDCTPNPCTSPA